MQTHTHAECTLTMQYGKGITTGLILEPSHRQGELERRKGTSGLKQTAIPNLTLKGEFGFFKIWLYEVLIHRKTYFSHRG